MILKHPCIAAGPSMKATILIIIVVIMFIIATASTLLLISFSVLHQHRRHRCSYCIIIAVRATC